MYIYLYSYLFQGLNATFVVTVTTVIRPGKTDRSAFVNLATVIQTLIKTLSVIVTGRLANVLNVSTTRADRNAINVYRVNNITYKFSRVFSE